VATVDNGNVLGHRQAEPQAWVTIHNGWRAVERKEDSLAFLLRDAWAAVKHEESDSMRAMKEGDDNFVLGSGVQVRVLQQVA
jgi:hypothetical protein